MGTAKQPDDDKTTSGAAPPEDQPHIVLDDHHRSRQLPQGNPQTFTQTIELKAISPRSRAGVSPSAQSPHLILRVHRIVQKTFTVSALPTRKDRSGPRNANGPHDIDHHVHVRQFSEQKQIRWSFPTQRSKRRRQGKLRYSPRCVRLRLAHVALSGSGSTASSREECACPKWTERNLSLCC